jgi:carboxylesterase type B
MISPMSQNLFHRGISQSGTLQNFWADPDLPGVARSRADLVAAYLNCSGVEDTKLMVECLREKNAEDLAETLTELFVSLVGLQYSDRVSKLNYSFFRGFSSNTQHPSYQLWKAHLKPQKSLS